MYGSCLPLTSLPIYVEADTSWMRYDRILPNPDKTKVLASASITSLCTADW